MGVKSKSRVTHVEDTPASTFGLGVSADRIVVSGIIVRDGVCECRAELERLQGRLSFPVTVQGSRESITVQSSRRDQTCESRWAQWGASTY